MHPHTPTPQPLEETPTIVCALADDGLLHIHGPQATEFLAGQLSSDIVALAKNANQYSSHSTAKGRVLATFLIWQQGDGFVLQLPNTLLEPIQKRLSMYILRAKVRITNFRDQYTLFGLAGPTAAQAIQQWTGSSPLNPHETRHVGTAAVLRITGNRYQICVENTQAAAVWEHLSAQAQPVLYPTWALSEIRAGIPWITPATQDTFVAQMINLDQIGAVSFTKGCYTGQEIIARTQYLGKLKRRMVHIAFSAPHAAGGDMVYSDDMGGQPSGQLVNVVSASPVQMEALAVIQSSSLSHPLYLQASHENPITLLDFNNASN